MFSWQTEKLQNRVFPPKQQINFFRQNRKIEDSHQKHIIEFSRQTVISAKTAKSSFYANAKLRFPPKPQSRVFSPKLQCCVFSAKTLFVLTAKTAESCFPDKIIKLYFAQTRKITWNFIFHQTGNHVFPLNPQNRDLFQSCKLCLKKTKIVD